MSSNNITPKLAKELEHLINKNLDTSYFPYVKGKSIRIRHIIVRETRAGFFLVFDTKEHKEIGKMFCKTSAVALAKTVAMGREGASRIKELDSQIQKHFNDAVFYRYTMRVTKDDIKFDVAQTRYDIASTKTHNVKAQLDSFIYS